jgi:hypothetical protein
MSVIVDDTVLAADSLGLTTFGQLLNHVQSKNRLIVSVLIDGHEPDLDHIETLRSQLVADKVVFIETVEPSQIAADVFSQVNELLDDADVLRDQAVDHLQAGEHADALKKLGSCFTTWNHTQESIEKIAKLLRVDLNQINLADGSLQDWLEAFGAQLQDIRSALEARDYSQLGDILAYEAHDTGNRWRQAIQAINASLKND